MVGASKRKKKSPAPLFTFKYRGNQWSVEFVPAGTLQDAHAEVHFQQRKILVETTDWSSWAPSRIREILLHELSHVLFEHIFAGIADDEQLTLTCAQLDETVAVCSASGLLEIWPQLPEWLTNQLLPIPFQQVK